MTVWKFKWIYERFQAKNLKKIQQKNMNMWGWQKMPDIIKHYKVLKKEWLVRIPNWIRGFWDFRDDYWSIVNCKHPSIYNKHKWNELDLRQDKAVGQLTSKNVWLLHASTAVGKTMITAKIIDKFQTRSLIIVPNLTLMRQMRDDLEEIFWVKCKTLSWQKTKQKWAYKGIIIANIDTVVKQSKKWLDQFDLTIIDEVDSCWLQAERRLAFTGNLTSKYLYWLTGTIKLNHVDNKVFPIYLWDKTELLIKHFTPVVNKIFTEFEYILDDLKEFHELKKALYENETRNDLIIKTITDTLSNRKWIVFCEYVDHAKLLKDKLEKSWIKTFILIWEVKKEEREKIKSELKNHKWKCILIGSVKIIWRGFNVPELSIWYLTTAEKFNSNIEQYVWRIIRKFEWKTEALWYDFVDSWCKLLYNQSKNRTTTYKREFPWIQINNIYQWQQTDTMIQNWRNMSLL